MLSDIAAAVALEVFDIGAQAVHVHGVELVAHCSRPLVGLVDHHANVCMAAAEVVGRAVARLRPGLAGVEVPVVGVHVEPLIDAGVWVGAEVLQEVRARNVVPEVAVDGVDEEQFAVLVPVVPPWVGGAVAEDFDDFAPRMVAKNSTLHRLAICLGGPWFSDIAGARVAAAPIEPTVWSPAQAVGEVVVIVFGDGEAVEHDLGLPVWDVVAIGIWDEQQLRWAHQPDPAVPDLDTGEHLQVIGKYLVPIRAAIPVLVVEDQDAITQLEVEALLTFGIGEVLGNPHAPAVIPGHRNRVAQLGFRGVDGGTKPGRKIDHPYRFHRRWWVGALVWFAVVGLREFRFLSSAGRKLGK